MVFKDENMEKRLKKEKGKDKVGLGLIQIISCLMDESKKTVLACKDDACPGLLVLARFGF